MTIQEARAAIGQRFKVTELIGIAPDVILRVDDDGTVHGEFVCSNVEDIRLVGTQPEQLQKNKTV